jgi:aspartyl protease family protein
MNPDQIASLAYLALLGAVIAGFFFMQNRDSLGKTAQQAAVWGLIFVGTIAAVGLWSDIRNDVAPRQSVIGEASIEVPRSRDGHYYLRAEINGAPVDFVVDTGATDMVLSRRDAARAGIDPDDLAYLGSAMTANGMVRTATVRLDSVRVGGIEDRGVRAVVTDGDFDGSLLGMGYLNLYERIAIENNRLMLTR